MKFTFKLFFLSPIISQTNYQEENPYSHRNVYLYQQQKNPHEITTFSGVRYGEYVRYFILFYAGARVSFARCKNFRCCILMQ